MPPMSELNLVDEIERLSCVSRWRSRSSCERFWPIPRKIVTATTSCGSAAWGQASSIRFLDRLEKAGWLRRARERLDTAVAGRPPRVLYRLTAEGQRAARLELAALTEQLRIPAESRGRLRPELGGAR